MPEPVWMALPLGSGERLFVQGLIQLANGFLKLRMGRPRAARRLCAMARDPMMRAGPAATMGLPPAEIVGMVDSPMRAMEREI